MIVFSVSVGDNLVAYSSDGDEVDASVVIDENTGKLNVMIKHQLIRLKAFMPTQNLPTG